MTALRRGADPRWLALVALFVLSLPLVTPRIYASDEIQYFAHLRSAWFDRDLSFENEYQFFYDHGIAKSPDFHETFLERTSATGRRLNFAPIGCALLWAPFYAAGDLTARLLNHLGYGVPVDGYSTPYIRAVAYASAIYGFLALLLALASVARVRRRPLLTTDYVAALAVWWGTPLIFYMYIAPPMSHATSAFTVSVFVWAWLRVRERWTLGGFAALGALAALVAMVREQDVFILVGPAIDLACSVAQGRRHRQPSTPVAQGFSPAPAPAPVHAATAGRSDDRPLRTAAHVATGLALAAACFALVYWPQALAYLALNGCIAPANEVSRKMTWYSPHAWGVLASPEHGFLFWTPLAALALAGLGWITARANRRLGLCLLAMVASQVYIAGVVESWTVAGAFGQRRFVALTVILAIGLAALIEAAAARRATRAAVLTLAAIATWWNVGLIVQFGSGLMDRQRIDLGRITYNNFIAVPRQLPDLAYRYVFARSSFYKPAAAAPDRGR